MSWKYTEKALHAGMEMLACKGRKRFHVSPKVHMQTTDPSPTMWVQTTSQAAPRAQRNREQEQEQQLVRPARTHATLPSPCLPQPPQPYEKRNAVKNPPYSTPSVDSHTSLSKFQWQSPQTRDFFSLIFVCNHKRPQVAKAM